MKINQAFSVEIEGKVTLNGLFNVEIEKWVNFSMRMLNFS